MKICKFQLIVLIFLSNISFDQSCKVSGTTTCGYNSSCSDWNYIVNACEKVSDGYTNGDASGARKYYFEMLR